MFASQGVPARRRLLTACLPALAVAVAMMVCGSLPAAASGPYPPGSEGSDISWPQCTRGGIPISKYGFGIVGVNGGAPFTANPCFAAEYTWASSGGTLPSLYMNLEYGERTQGFQSCLDSDHYCRAYNFGYYAALDAYVSANVQTRLASLNPGIVWWLDVETENVWSEHPEFNREVIRGAVDYLQKYAGRTVGVYSTRHQWLEIAGPSYTPPGVGNWVAGADSLRDYNMCFQPLWPGAAVWMYQYLNYGADLDQDHSC